MFFNIGPIRYRQAGKLVQWSDMWSVPRKWDCLEVIYKRKVRSARYLSSHGSKRIKVELDNSVRVTVGKKFVMRMDSIY